MIKAIKKVVNVTLDVVVAMWILFLIAVFIKIIVLDYL